MDSDKSRFQYAGLKWLYEMELVNDPQFINNMKLNIFSTSPNIKEVELLISREHKAMLVYLEINWLGRKFYKKSIFAGVNDILTQLLPSFRFRVTDDPKIMSLAVEKVKAALTGGTNEKPNTNLDSTIPSDHISFEGSANPKTSSLSGNPYEEISDIEKQSISNSSVFSETGQKNSGEKS